VAAAVIRTEAKSSNPKNLKASAGAIQQVRLAQNGGATEVSISGSGPLTYHALHLRDPDRLVLDFSGSHLNTPESHISSSFDPVRSIRMGQFTPETSRVVIDLSQPARYSIIGNGNTVTVTLSPAPLARRARMYAHIFYAGLGRAVQEIWSQGAPSKWLWTISGRGDK
jgi:hypothetical protein